MSIQNPRPARVDLSVPFPAVMFAAAANSWTHSRELRDRLLAAADKTTAPIMLIQAAND